VVHNGEVFVSVADTGAGIAAEEISHIFDAFYQGDGSLVRAHAGTGLGLSITRMLVELLHGRIEVSSGQGEGGNFDTPVSGVSNTGTTVTFVLPEASPEEIYDRNKGGVNLVEPVFPNLPGADVATSSVHELRKHLEHSASGLFTPSSDGPNTILAIDDDPVNLRVLEAILLGKGLRLVTATSGRDAEALVEEEEPDLILLDLMMPGVSGYEVCSTLRQQYDAVELPIIMVTARTQTEDLVHAYDSGANDYITKPFDADELLARIYSHLHIKKLVNTLKENEQLKEEIRLRKRAEYSLQASQSRLTELLDLDESAILCFDHQYQAVYFNKGAYGLFGYTSAELEGLSLESLFDQGLPELLEQSDGIEGDPGRLHTILNCKHRDGHSFKGDAVVNLLDVDASGGLAVVLNPYAGEHGLHVLGDNEALKKRDSQLEAVEQSINSILEIARSNPELLSRMAGADLIPETDVLPASNKQLLREHSVTVMGRALAYWEHDTGKNKIDLAEESMIWPVYIDKSTPTTRTLDKYLHLNTIPKNPRAQRVIDTAEFVLRKCAKPSGQRKELEEALNNLRLVLSGKSPL
jgi:two-component system sensor histidine kinase ChiS